MWLSVFNLYTDSNISNIFLIILFHMALQCKSLTPISSLNIIDLFIDLEVIDVIGSF